MVSGMIYPLIGRRNMRVSIALDFGDREYEEALSGALNRDFVVRTDGTDADLVLSDNRPDSGNHILLSGDQRFIGADAITDLLISRYTANYGRYEPALAFSECVNICVCSPSGGSGTSTIAVDIARNYQNNGFDTIYLTLDLLPVPGTEKGKGDLNELLYMLKEDREISSVADHTWIDEYGLTHMTYMQPYNSLNEMDPVDLEKLLWHLSKLFQCIVFDTGSVVSPRSLCAMNTADRIVLVVNENDGKRDRFAGFIGRRPDITVLNRSYDYNSAEDMCIANLEGDELDFDNEMGSVTNEIMVKLNECEGNT